MKTREQRERELLSDGFVDAIKSQFRNGNYRIPEKYYILIADYIDSISQLQDDFYLDPVLVAKMIPEAIKEIREEPIGAYGMTDDGVITMRENMSYEKNKLYFFHELTHIIQTKMLNGQEVCGFSDGKTGMFLTEGATQFIAEILYHISDGTNITYREQEGGVRCQPEHKPYSALSEYQLNGNILMLLGASVGLKLNEMLALSYRQDGREMLKGLYDTVVGEQGKFEDLMFELEQIYTIDKCIIGGYEQTLREGSTDIEMNSGRHFTGSIESEGELINKVERELMANFIGHNDYDYIMQKWELVYNSLTSTQLRKEFLAAIKEVERIEQEYNPQVSGGPRR